MLHRITALLFPPKCVFCRTLLAKEETDLCHSCRQTAPEVVKTKNSYSFVARWTAVWYYKGAVRSSLLRYKFRRKRHYAAFYGRQLALKILSSGMNDFDVLSWVPVSRLRKWRRGYDQAKLLAQAVAEELGTTAIPCLQKVRHTPPQSGFPEASQRRANVVNAYRVTAPEAVIGKRILLIDDIITTGATLSECAKTLLIAGGAEITGAAVAVAAREKKQV